MGSKIEKIYVAMEYTKSPTYARKFFKNRKIKGARIHRLVKTGNGTEVYFTK